MEFILPSAVVLTSFRPTIVPMLGYVEDAGIDDENRHDPKEYRDDFYKGQTDSFVGTRAAVHDQDHGHRPRRLHDQFGGNQDGRYGQRRAAGALSGRATTR